MLMLYLSFETMSRKKLY